MGREAFIQQLAGLLIPGLSKLFDICFDSTNVFKDANGTPWKTAFEEKCRVADMSEKDVRLIAASYADIAYQHRAFHGIVRDAYKKVAEGGTLSPLHEEKYQAVYAAYSELSVRNDQPRRILVFIPDNEFDSCSATLSRVLGVEQSFNWEFWPEKLTRNTVHVLNSIDRLNRVTIHWILCKGASYGEMENFLLHFSPSLVLYWSCAHQDDRPRALMFSNRYSLEQGQTQPETPLTLHLADDQVNIFRIANFRFKNNYTRSDRQDVHQNLTKKSAFNLIAVNADVDASEQCTFLNCARTVEFYQLVSNSVELLSGVYCEPVNVFAFTALVVNSKNDNLIDSAVIMASILSQEEVVNKLIPLPLRFSIGIDAPHQEYIFVKTELEKILKELSREWGTGFDILGYGKPQSIHLVCHSTAGLFGYFLCVKTFIAESRLIAGKFLVSHIQLAGDAKILTIQDQIQEYSAQNESQLGNEFSECIPELELATQSLFVDATATVSCRTVNMTETAKRLLGRLHPDQLRAVMIKQGPILVAAGPGAGKTRVLAIRTAALIQIHGVKEDILLLTFAKKSASEMESRLRALLLPEEMRQVTVGTFHQVCLIIGSKDSRSPVRVLDEEGKTNLIQKCMYRLQPKDPRRDSSHSTKISATYIAKRISEAKNTGSDHLQEHKAASESQDPERQWIAMVFSEYEADKKRTNAEQPKRLLDFDDLILFGIENLQRDPQLAERFRYVLVDEYQDTNNLQNKFLTLLCNLSKHRNFFFVGDPAQCIYGFRSVKIRDFFDVPKAIFSPDLEILQLPTNFRSTQTLVKVAHAIVRGSTEFRPLEISANREDIGPLVQYRQFVTFEEQIMDITEEIKHLTKHSGGRIRFEHIAILSRLNAGVTACERKLVENMVPVSISIKNATQFFMRKEIQVSISFLRALLLDSNSEHYMSVLLEIINIPNRGVGPRTMVQLKEIYNNLRNQNNTVDIFNLLENFPWKRNQLNAKAFCQRLQQARNDARNNPVDTVLRLLFTEIDFQANYLGKLPKLVGAEVDDQSSEVATLLSDAVDDYQELDLCDEDDNTEYDARTLVTEITAMTGSTVSTTATFARTSSSRIFDASETSNQSSRRWKNVEQLLNMLQSSTSDLPLPLHEKNLRALEIIDSQQTTQDRVTLSTIHSAKGLEWPIVFLINIDGYEFPSDDEEARRILFVAVTRTEILLRISWTSTFIYPGTQHATRNIECSFLQQALTHEPELFRERVLVDEDVLDQVGNLILAKDQVSLTETVKVYCQDIQEFDANGDTSELASARTALDENPPRKRPLSQGKETQHNPQSGMSTKKGKSESKSTDNKQSSIRKYFSVESTKK